MNLDDSNLLMDINDSFIFKESPINSDDDCILSTGKQTNKIKGVKEQDDQPMQDVAQFETDAKAEIK